jgi:hypothetical protein
VPLSPTTVKRDVDQNHQSNFSFSSFRITIAITDAPQKTRNFGRGNLHLPIRSIRPLILTATPPFLAAEHQQMGMIAHEHLSHDSCLCAGTIPESTIRNPLGPNHSRIFFVSDPEPLHRGGSPGYRISIVSHGSLFAHSTEHSILMHLINVPFSTSPFSNERKTVRLVAGFLPDP